MGFLDRFRGKKEKKEETGRKEALKHEPTDLELFCADDPEVYEALAEVMILDPRKVGLTSKEAAEKAKKAEKDDETLAAFWYRIAGGLAIYEGAPKKVEQYLGKATKLNPRLNFKIMGIADKAVKKAQEYYARYLKEKPEQPS